MLKQFFQDQLGNRHNVTIHTNGELTVSACQIVKHNNQLDFEQKITGLKTLEELNKTVNELEQPVSFNIPEGNTHKQVEKDR